MMSFFAPPRYHRGPLARGLATSYLLVTGALVALGFAEQLAAGTSEGSFFFGFAMLLTMPLSLGVLFGYSAIETARGIPMADQDGGLWMYPAFAVCALVNAFLVWVVFRGRRIVPAEPDPSWPTPPPPEQRPLVQP